jgi:serine/threonine protein kinase/WD40 repeat protein
MNDRDPHTRTEGETLDMPEGIGAFSSGQVLGERYEILEMLGRGGMGEVWHAVDLKLRVEVALKALRPEFFKSERRLELLRQEVRAAREVMSPNVCRIFDLIEIEGRELVSMEYVDGATLLGVLQERGPLDLKEAQDIASQFLAGLEAIHRVGLIHRDIKPENIMLTRAGRVVVMDFGLARQEEEGGGSVAGTPAYMAPEQAAGQQLDARADVYAAGVVLAEMVSPEGIKSSESRQSVWEGVRSEPSQVPDSPWAPVIQRAVARDRERRQNSAHTLIRELEDVTLRVEGAEDLHPYPGLASFTEADAEYFFGREAEVEQMWRKLECPPRLFAIMGPSGAGKSSFIRAGLFSAAPPSWSHVVSTPGNAAISSLGRVMAREMAGDADMVEKMVDFDDLRVAVEVFSRWSSQTDRALLVVDQFEELFTQNPPENQEGFSELLHRLVIEANVHVVLSMRDDFLMRCRDFDALQPTFADMTALPTLSGHSLRRALVRPATKCGYRFEDDELVEEMLGEVEDERGALPLLAFAAAELWDRRDRETGFLTRAAYHEIGGVGGALAQHAEATIERIGSQRIPVVRELFRNLVTAEGTRAVREWSELLSVFDHTSVGAGFTPARESAEEVLRELIDARLLTSYEVRDEDAEPIRRIEIIHESLLANWPRLVRWQTQDADAAQLRDQLRQAARTWDDQGRSDDTLWTGSAYREFAVWRERYPGGLTAVEEAFATAMTALAMRRRRRRRIAIAAAFATLIAVLAIIGGFWRRSLTEARRAEAANLLSLAQLQLEDHPTATVAYAIRSLESADSQEMRRLALEALWRGPTEFRIPTGSLYSVEFSPDGNWLLTTESSPREDGVAGLLWPADGGAPTALETKVESGGEYRFSPDGTLMASYFDGFEELGLWSHPSGRFLRSLPVGGSFNQLFWFSDDGARLITSSEYPAGEKINVKIRSWLLKGGEPDLLGWLDIPRESGGTFAGVDPSESHLAWIEGRTFNLAPLEGSHAAPSLQISLEHDWNLSAAVFDDRGQQLATSDMSGTITVWSLARDRPERVRTIEAGFANNWCSLRFNRSGTMVCALGGYLVDLTAPPNTLPLRLRRPGGYGYGQVFEPNGRWFAIGHQDAVSLWPLSHEYPHVLPMEVNDPTAFLFSPDGDWFAWKSTEGAVGLQPLRPGSGQDSSILFQAEGAWEAATILAMAPDGSFLATGNPNGRVRVIPVDGGPSRELVGFTDALTEVVVGPESRLVAAGAGSMYREQALARVWDLESGEVRILDAGDGIGISLMWFTDKVDLWVMSGSMLRRWNLNGDRPQIAEEVDLSGPEFSGHELCAFDPDLRRLLLEGPDSLWINDLDTLESRELTSHGRCTWFSLQADGEIVLSIDPQGGILVGPVTGEDPHLLLGREEGFFNMSSDGHWIAARGADNTIMLWTTPDLTKPPFHTLPREELIARLKTLTNLRVVEAPDEPSGWKLTVGPFPGWQTVPTW